MTSHSLSQSIIAIIVLALTPVPVQAQCTFDRRCTIGPNQRCPNGCSRTEFCTKTATQTLPPSTRTIIQTQKASPVTVTITPSSSSTVPPACKTEVPYANLFSFPDNKCRNSTGTLGVNLPLECDGLVGPPLKFNTLKPNPDTKYNESSCVTLPIKGDGARSICFTVDGQSALPYASCTMNLFKNKKCRGNADARFLTGDARECLAASANLGPWKSAVFKCAYLEDLCTETEIILGTCNKFQEF